MEAPISALAKYFLNGYAGKNLKTEFVDITVHGMTKKLEDGFYVKRGSMTIIDFTKDAKGNPIDETHPHYILSKAIQDFSNGEKLILKKDDLKKICNLETFFEKNGEHFCAGYLSKRFGEVVRPTITDYWIFDELPYIYHKVSEREQYKTALEVWEHFRYPELKKTKTHYKK